MIYVIQRTNIATLLAELCRALLFAGVSIIPGTKFHCSEPGWFRILFSVPEEELQEGTRAFV